MKEGNGEWIGKKGNNPALSRREWGGGF